jgi:hypothetical protein
LAMGRTPPEGNPLQVIEKSWEYAISSVPTHHLEECFRRALGAKRDTFPFAAPEVSRAWEELQQELLRNPPADDVPLLMGPQSGYMTIGEFKARHRLPVEWALGDPYPPESDLYRKPLPRSGELDNLVSCPRCKDAGWTRLPYNAALGMPAKMMRCECQD